MAINSTGRRSGRPTIYTDELADELCVLIATTSKSIKTICAENKHLPQKTIVFHWLYDDKHEFSGRYARAKAIQAELGAEECDDVLTECEEKYAYIDERGAKRIDNGHVQLAKLKVENKRFMARQRLPKVYGDAKEETASAVPINVNIDLSLDKDKK